MIYKTPEIDDAEAAVIARIDELKRQLAHVVAGTPRRWHGLLRRMTLARAVQGSNSIEGYDVALDDAIAAAEGEEPLDPKTEAWVALAGYQSAMTYVLHLASDAHFSYSCDLLRALHFMMLQHNIAKHPGRWRPGVIFVIDEARNERVYEGPDRDFVPGLMEELVNSLRTVDAMRTPAVVLGAMAHLNLAMIHPFSDGNGRMARCLQTLVLARSGVLAAPFSSIEEYLGRNQRSYYDVLALVGQGSWHPERDARPWVRYCLTAHYRQAMTLLNRNTNLERLWNALEEEVRRRRLPERTVLALADAAHGLRVRNATYRPLAEISYDLASRDLRLLVDEGLLVPQGEKRGRHYVASDPLKSIRAATHVRRQIEDPFEVGPGNGQNVLPGMAGLIT